MKNKTSDDEIHKIQEMIKNRPMKLLNWRSPADISSSLSSDYYVNKIQKSSLKSTNKSF